MTKTSEQNNLAALLGGFTNDKASTPGGKKTYPTLPDEDGFVAKAVDERGKLHTEMKSLKGRLDKLDGALKERALEHCFRHNENNDKPDTTIEIHGSSNSVKVSITDRYYPIALDSEGVGQTRLDNIKKLVGGSQYSQHVTEGFEVNISASDIPLPHQGEFLEAVAQICRRFSVVPSSKRSATLAKAFHLSRHSTLTPDENAKFHELWPSTISLR